MSNNIISTTATAYVEKLLLFMKQQEEESELFPVALAQQQAREVQRVIWEKLDGTVLIKKLKGDAINFR